MANILGIPDYNPALDIENSRIQAGLVQQLGKQVREDITTIQTNRQLQGLAQGLQSLDTNTPEFGKQAVGLMMQYPLAAKSPIGTAAISQLGAQHKLWQQEQLKAQNPYAIQGGYRLNRQTGDYQELPAKPGSVRPIVVGDSHGKVMVNPTTGEPIATFGDPFAEAQPKPNIKVINGTAVDLTDPANPKEVYTAPVRPSPTVGKPNPYGEKMIMEKKKEAEAAQDELEAAANALLEARPGVMGTGIGGMSKSQIDELTASVAEKKKMLARAMESYKHVQDYFRAPVSAATQEPIIPGVPPAAAVGQVGGAATPEALIPAMPVQPTLQQVRRLRFNKDSDTLE